MTEFFDPLRTALSDFGWRDAADIIILAVVCYSLLKILYRTRAMRVVLGLVILLIAGAVAQLLNLVTVSWVFEWLVQASAVFLVILFQPELRRALEKLGRGKIFTSLHKAETDREDLIHQFTTALTNMARTRTGAIIVFERQTGLADIVESGIVVDADVSAQLIETIFYPNNPLHDGAMIIKEGRIWAAGCFLPLSDNRSISSQLGSRHRASLGVSEVSDAYVLVVSEERGTISFVYDGVITQGVSADRLRSILEDVYEPVQRGFSAWKKYIAQAAGEEEIEEAEELEKGEEPKKNPEKNSGAKEDPGADTSPGTQEEDQ